MVPTFNKTDYPIKHKSRERAFKNVGPCKYVLLLPGQTAEDYHYAVDLGVIVKNTKVLFVENNTQVQTKLKNKFEFIDGFEKPIFFLGNLNSLKIPWTQIDFCWLDLLGNLSLQDCEWVKLELAPKIHLQSIVCFTFQAAYRNNSMLGDLVDKYRQNPKLIEEYAFSRKIQPKYFSYMAAHIEQIESLFSNYSPNIEYSEYTDKNSKKRHRSEMLFYKATNFRSNKLICTRKKALTNFPRKEPEMSAVAVVDAVIAAQKKNASAGTKAKAARLLNRYLDLQEDLGKSRTQCHAAIKAHVTMRNKK